MTRPSARPKLRFALFAGLVLMGPAGCSDGTVAGTGPSDAAASTTGDATDTASPSCNTLVDISSAVGLSAKAAAAPVATGGSIANGTYVLTSATLYTGAGGSATAPAGAFKATFEVAGTTLQQIGSINGAERRYTSTLSSIKTTLTITDTCPTPKTATFEYTATSTELLVLGKESRGTLVQTYTKR